MMRRHLRLAPAASFAILVFTLAVQTAHASRLGFSTNTTTMVWSPLEFTSAGSTIRCFITLEGSLHSRTFVKTRGLLIGHLTRIRLNRCEGGSATVLTEAVPSHVKYGEFFGALPSILRTLWEIVTGMTISLRPSGSLTCLMAPSEAHPLRLLLNREAGGTITSATFEAGAEIPLTGELGLCAFGGSAHLSGTTSSVSALSLSLAP